MIPVRVILVNNLLKGKTLGYWATETCHSARDCNLSTHNDTNALDSVASDNLSVLPWPARNNRTYPFIYDVIIENKSYM